ncbi:MAG: DUF2723 domain-containing protein [Bacteroidetes bacterium]|nr:DUF2723 domain-containing protein [Bacteroidota bacterium]
MRWAERRALLVVAPAGVVFLGSLGLYWASLAPGPTGGDSGEFQFVPYVLGIPHHTGYPLYTLLGKLWTFLPLGNVAYRMNLLSAVLGAMGVAIVFLLGQSLTRSRWAGLAGAAAMAVSPLFWLWSTIAGVRTASVLLPALVLWLAFEWSERKETRTVGADIRAASRGRDASGDGWLIALALAFGAGLAHHRSAIYLAPALLPFVLLVDRRVLRRWRTLAPAAAAAILPLLTYAYLPLRSRAGAPFDQFHPDTWGRFWDLVLAVPLSQSFFSIPADAVAGRLSLAGATLAGEFGAAGVALAAAGIVALALRHPKTLVLLVTFFAGTLAQTLAWNVGQQRLNVAYLLPAYPVLGVAVAAGADALWRLAALLAGSWRFALGLGPAPAQARVDHHSPADAARATRSSPQHILTGMLPAIVFLAFLWLGAERWQMASAASVQPLDRFRADLSRGTAAQRLVLSSLPYMEPEALVVGNWEQATPFWYYQYAEGLSPSVGVSYALDDLDRMLAESPDRPVYLALASPKASGKRLTMLGPLVKIVSRPSTAPPADIAPPAASLEGGLRLLGALFFDPQGHRTGAPPDDGDVVGVQLYWQAASLLERDYSVSVRMVDAGGAVVAQQDNQHPVLGMYPTSRWSAGEVVGDYYELPRRGLAPGSYRLEVVVYERLAQGFRNLRVLGADGRAAGETVVLASGIAGGP